MLQQPLFAPDTAAETDQFAITSDHAVAGNNQGDWVFVVGVAHSPEGPGAADGPGNVSVGGRLTKGNFLQLPPDGFLKIGSLQQQRNVEFAALAFEIFIHLLHTLLQAGRQVAVNHGWRFIKRDRQNAFLIADNFKRPNFRPVARCVCLQKFLLSKWVTFAGLGLA